MNAICFLEQSADDGPDVLGGKGWNLAALLRAGLPVPSAFCLTADAFRQSAQAGHTAENRVLGAALAAELSAAYDRLGQGPVAVRSSATVEDGAVSSFAGLQETILGVEGADALVEAIERCWRSLDSQRAQAYRRHGDVDERQLAMAVVVQRLVAAEVAGVLFTSDPLDASGRQMLVEASWGLGEAVVSGLVTPDRFQIERDTGRLCQATLGNKTVEVTPHGPRPVDEARQHVACLGDEQLAQLAALGRQVEDLYGEPRDIEWAWARGQLWLLQARPITAAGAREREQFRHQEIARLSAMVDERGTAWARYNLAEVLPAPTPMTWAIVSRFMSGRGGFGLMFRDLGFDPDPALDELGFIDLVCGRPYVNLSREAKLHFAGFPYSHKLAELKQHPERAQYAQPVPDPALITRQFLLRLPLYAYRMLRASRRIERASRKLPKRLRKKIFPKFAAAARAALAEDLSVIGDEQLLARLENWCQRTLIDFARVSLQPATLATTALARLEAMLVRQHGTAGAATRARELLTGIEPDAEADLGAALGRLAQGSSRTDFLAAFGHRGPNEMELAEPRWSERPELLPQVDDATGVQHAIAARSASPAEGGKPTAGASAAATPAKLSRWRRKAFAKQLRRLQTFVALRETGKHYLMLGYAVVRQTLVELGRRHRLGGGVFYLLPDELPRLLAGEDLSVLVAARKQQRAISLSLELPLVLFSDELEAIGRAPEIVATAELQGAPVSAGVCEGPALVLLDPAAAPPGEGFVLICPSTDPAWVPLFLRARGLVMETGGILSHGAIIAREFGLPAVVGIEHVTRRVQTGQRVRVDGNTGTVHILE